MSTEEKAFITGIVFLAAAMLSVTVVPIVLQKYASCYFSHYTYAQIEFYLLFMCAGLYACSSKFYQLQIYSIFGALIFYIMFVRAFH